MAIYYKRKNKSKPADDANPLRAGAGLLGREFSENPWQGVLMLRQKKGEIDVYEKIKRARMLGRELYFTLLTREAHSSGTIHSQIWLLCLHEKGERDERSVSARYAQAVGKNDEFTLN